LDLVSQNRLQFHSEEIGEDTIKKFKSAEIEVLKPEDAAPLFVLKLVRSFSPGIAFTLTTRQMSHQLQ